MGRRSGGLGQWRSEATGDTEALRAFRDLAGNGRGRTIISFLTEKLVGLHLPRVQVDLGVIDRAEAAAAVLDPAKVEVLERFAAPDSAAGVARALGLPRQRVGYHVRELERLGLLEHVEDRKRGNCIERVLRATAKRYVISPAALGRLGADASSVADVASSAYLIAAAAGAVRDVARMRERARAADLRLPTLTLQSEIRFRDPAARGAFAQELAEFVARASARYHDETAPEGRRYRLLIAGYPAPATGAAGEET